MNTMSSLLQSIDGFGHRIQLLYKGKTSYTTRLGGIFTLLTICLVVLNAIYVIHTYSASTH